jgi:hypothetical protein
MSDEEQKRKQLFAALKGYFERYQGKIDREATGQTQKEKSEAIDQTLSDSPEAACEKAKLEGLTSILRGKKLQHEENQSDRDYSAGGFYSEKSEAIYLFADQTFRYEKRTFSSVSGGGLSLPSESKRTAEGNWAVEMVAGEPHLVLRKDESVIESWRTSDGGVGVQYLNGVRWNRYKM